MKDLGLPPPLRYGHHNQHSPQGQSTNRRDALERTFTNFGKTMPWTTASAAADEPGALFDFLRIVQQGVQARISPPSDSLDSLPRRGPNFHDLMRHADGH